MWLMMMRGIGEGSRQELDEQAVYYYFIFKFRRIGTTGFLLPRGKFQFIWSFQMNTTSANGQNFSQYSSLYRGREIVSDSHVDS